MNLSEKSCAPCGDKNPTLEINRANELLDCLGNRWEFNSDGHLEKTFIFKAFVDTMAFANSITSIAEKSDSNLGVTKQITKLAEVTVSGIVKFNFR